jgi:hypothetical protein
VTKDTLAAPQTSPKAKQLLVQFLEQSKFSKEKLSDRSSLKDIVQEAPEEQAHVLVAALEVFGRQGVANEVHRLASTILKNPMKFFTGGGLDLDDLPTSTADSLRELIIHLYKRPLPLQDNQVTYLVQYATRTTKESRNFMRAADLPSSGVIACVERYAQKNGLSEPLKVALNEYSNAISVGPAYYSNEPSAEGKKAMARIRVLVASDKDDRAVPILPGDAWSIQALSDLEAMTDEQRRAWTKLISTCFGTDSSKPSGKWLKDAESLLRAIGDESFVDHLDRWFSLVPKKGTVQSSGRHEDELIQKSNEDILRGLAWCCSLRKDARVANALGDAAESCFKKVPDIGPRSPRVANACVYALAQMNTKEAVAQLSRVQVRAKHSSSKAQIEKAMNRAAEQAGMSVDDLQELGVPDHGFAADGRRVEKFGDFSAELSIGDDLSVHMDWCKSDGTRQQSVPAAVKKDHAAELKSLKKVQTEVEKLLPVVRHRIEHSLLNQRHWTYTTWKERYLDHPICSNLARRLLWNFSGRAGIWHEGKIVGLDGNQIQISESDIVELWHPISADAETVLQWRRWLLERNIKQPFKQAHREIYVLTDAERETNTYSNRFAAHIIRQHQFTELCHQRGWRYTLQGQFDSHNTPTLNLPRWNLNVEFWVDPVEGHQPNEHFIYMLLFTDQVRFVRPGGEPIALTELMPIVFSECMRDVDLFVGVSSIGNDPNWQDQGAHRDYWWGYSFGDLGHQAQTRKQVLQELVPSLKIAPRCTFTDKFLVVRGDLRIYKIHLGSGNILMEPNDQYLCIVPGRSTESDKTRRIFLPFEGDNTLSIILSKAFLLAEDAKIKDPSILNQIKRQTQ